MGNAPKSVNGGVLQCRIHQRVFMDVFYKTIDHKNDNNSTYADLPTFEEFTT
jgi:hypothetical protein